MTALLEPELRESKVVPEVRQVFSLGKGRAVAGCMVTEGTISRSEKPVSCAKVKWFTKARLQR